MAKKVMAVAFEKTNKAFIKGRIGHTRTGACPRKTGHCICAKKR